MTRDKQYYYRWRGGGGGAGMIFPVVKIMERVLLTVVLLLYLL